MANTGGLTDFLFQGAPPSVTQTTKSGSPVWLQQALFNTANAAGALAQQPYQPFQGPTVATPSSQTQQAWNLAGSNVGSYQPFLKQASTLTGQASAPITSSDINNFINPYQSYITGALNRNLQQNILPGIQDKFVSAGQTRSPQEAQVTGQAVQDTQNAVGQSLAGAYQGALNSLLQQRQQQGTLGAQYGQLGALTSQLGAGDVSQLAAAGQGQDTLAQANINSAINQYQNQQQYPYQQLGFLSNMLYGLPLQAAGTTSSSQATYYPQSNAGLTNYLGGTQALSGMGYRRGGRAKRGRGRGALAKMAKAA